MSADARPRIRRLQDLTAENWATRKRHEQQSASTRPAEFALQQLRAMEGADPASDAVGMIGTYEHSLQTATRAYRDGADEQTVVACLLHDIFDMTAPANHDAVAAEFLRPYITPTMYWVLRHHGVFQQFHMVGDPTIDRNARDAFRDHPAFEEAVRFCARWDQVSFDPEYDWLPLSFFEPMVHRVLSGGSAGH